MTVPARPHWALLRSRDAAGGVSCLHSVRQDQQWRSLARLNRIYSRGTTVASSEHRLSTSWQYATTIAVIRYTMLKRSLSLPHHRFV